MNKKQQFIVYKIYYGDELVYVGRTKQPLQDRMRGHMFKAPHLKVIDINQITKIEYTMLNSEADMFLVELYLICMYKPRLNKDDKPHDELSIFLPNLIFYSWSTPLWSKWKKEVNEKEIDYIKKKALKETKEEDWRRRKRNASDDYKDGRITHDEYFEICNEINEEKYRLQYEMGEIDFKQFKEAMGFYETERISLS